MSNSPVFFNFHLTRSPPSIGGMWDCMEEGRHWFHFPIIQITLESHIPTPFPSLLPPNNSNLKQDREILSKNLVTTPTIMPKLHLISQTSLKLNISTKTFPTHPDAPPKTTSMRTPIQLRNSSPPQPWNKWGGRLMSMDDDEEMLQLGWTDKTTPFWIGSVLCC